MGIRRGYLQCLHTLSYIFLILITRHVLSLQGEIEGEVSEEKVTWGKRRWVRIYEPPMDLHSSYSYSKLILYILRFFMLRKKVKTRGRRSRRRHLLLEPPKTSLLYIFFPLPNVPYIVDCSVRTGNNS